MKNGNQVVLLNTAPASALDEGLEIYRQRQGIAPGAPIPEAPGQEAEDNLIREVNKAEVEGTLTIKAPLVAPNSLGSIAYDSIKDTVLFTTTSTKGSVFEAQFSGPGSLSHSPKFHRSTGRSATFGVRIPTSTCGLCCPDSKFGLNDAPMLLRQAPYLALVRSARLDCV